MGLFQRQSLIEQLARQTGWRVIEREGDIYRIRADDLSPTYYVRIRYREDALNLTFQSYLPVRFPLSAITLELTQGLLVRNNSLIWSKWCLAPLGSCELQPYLYGGLPCEGLKADAFDDLCRSAIEEVYAVHMEMNRELSRLGPGQADHRQAEGRSGIPAPRAGGGIARREP